MVGWRGALLGLGLGMLAAGCRDAPQPPTGQTLYYRHCASCHGETGDGNGPVAGTLRRPPSDLRTIATRHDGSFDESYVIRIIDGTRLVAEHGSREMPVWGAVFEAQSEHYGGYTSLLHSQALTEYLRSIQQD